MVTIGTGANATTTYFSPALELIEDAEVEYLVFEMAAEITNVSNAKRAKEGGPGYARTLIERFEHALPAAVEHGTTIVTNGGSHDPIAAAKETVEIVEREGLDVDIVAVTGDGCLETLAGNGYLDESDIEFIAANAYIGAEEILGALEQADDDADARVIITGRVADPSLFVAPMVYELGWDLDDWDRLGQATVLGHLCECGPHVTGGYFMEPERKPVPDYHRLGFPYVEVEASGNAILTKPDDTGGRIDERTVLEQLYYEVHDPTAYVTPDVVADFTTARFEQVDDSTVRVTGGTGSERPDELKVIAGGVEGYKLTRRAAYGGPNAEARARQAGRILRRRLQEIWGYGSDDFDLRIDLVGLDSLYGDVSDGKSAWNEDDGEIRLEDQRNPDAEEVELRIAARSSAYEPLEVIAQEAASLCMCGPAGAGSVLAQNLGAEVATDIIGLEDFYLPREQLTDSIEYHRVASDIAPTDD